MSRHELAGIFEVLVVDDEPGVRDVIADYLADLGFTVTRAADGRAAILALERNPGRFGLVVTDLNLPEADGFQVLADARRANPHCYVVIVTGFASLDSAIQAVRAGAYDYLPKPFTLGQLDVILNRLTNHAQLERASRVQLERRESLDGRLKAIERALARVERRLEDLVESPTRH